jgi:hypothetical protein
MGAHRVAEPSRPGDRERAAARRDRAHHPSRARRRYDFTDITDAVTALEKAGFGFAQKGSAKGRFYDFDQVRRRTPSPGGVNTRKPA